ncbi:MAG: outer membrane beta-barrel protein [Segetibacter sp.]
MKRFFFALVCIFSLHAVHSQTISTTPATDSIVPVQHAPVKNDLKKIDLSNRSNDHIMIQYGFDNWAGTPDSISPKGFSRFFNAYIMLDKPFETNPHLSVGLGVGVGSSNIFFDKTYVDIKSNSSRLPFTNVASADHFKKFKLTTIFLEAPVELRYSSDPENTNKSLKMALGIKVGTLINAHTKGKNLQNKSGGALNNSIEKVSSKKFFNSTKLAATARIGYGIFGIYGAYQITSLLKTGAGPDAIHPYSIGIYISGL